MRSLNQLFLRQSSPGHIAPTIELITFKPFGTIRRIGNLTVAAVLGYRKVFLFLFLCSFLLTPPVFSQSDDDDEERDNQFRTEVEVAVPLYKGLNLFFGGDLRLGKFEGTRFVRGDVGFFYNQKINKYIEVEPGYRHRTLVEFSGKRDSENILFVNGKIGFDIKKFEIRQNNLVEFRFRSNDRRQPRYRPRLKVSHPVTIGETKIDVWASNEVYYEWADDAWTRNRFRVGINKKINENVNYDVYYLRQNDSFSKPGDLHVFGIAFEIGTKSPFPVD